MISPKSLLGLLASVSFSVFASTPTPFEKCAAIKNVQKRVACYDALSAQSPSSVNQGSGEARESRRRAEETKEGERKREVSTVSLQAGIVYRSGEVKPVARTTFYLLDESLAKILAKSGIPIPLDNVDTSAPNFYAYVYPTMLVASFAQVSLAVPALENAGGSSAQKLLSFHSRVIELFRPHIIQTGTTDFGGNVQFAAIPPGEYYVMGVARTQGGHAVWDHKIDATLPTMSVVLDQNNALSAK